MRIGVVCEGPTDAHAIVCFLQESLKGRGMAPVFVPIQPIMDNTRPNDGGWGPLMNWLESNPPKSRTKAYLRGGLFGNSLSAKRCDIMIFQMDSDVLSHQAFQNRMMNRFRYSVVNSGDPARRGSEIKRIVETVGRFGDLSPDDYERHIAAPSVESTETWCIAAHRRLEVDPEGLRGADLLREFMTALHESENRPIQKFVRINKDPDRRHRYCSNKSKGYRSIEAQCLHYKNLVDELQEWYASASA